MFLETTIILGVMVVIFIVALKFFKLTPELSMVIMALGGMAAGAVINGGIDEPVRHFVEGSTTFLDIMLTVIAATLFMNVFKEIGALNAIVRSIVFRFARFRSLLIMLVMVLILIPGALTGAGTASVLISGELAAIILGCLGIPMVNIAAIVFIGSVLSVAAPPVNIYAMIISAGVNMPYVGFFLPLLIPTLSIAMVSGLFLGWKGTPLNLEEAEKRLPLPPEGMKGIRVYFPIFSLIILMVAVRVVPHLVPVMGVPLPFLISTLVAVLVAKASGVKINIWRVSEKTMKQLFSLLAILVAIGILIQVMSLTGVRGLFVITIVSMPMILVYMAIAIGLPLGEAVLLFGVAAVLGVPLVLLFNSMAKGAILVTAAISLVCPLGDALPPTALMGRLITSELKYEGSYGAFLKKSIIPWIMITATAILMIFFA